MEDLNSFLAQKSFPPLNPWPVSRTLHSVSVVSWVVGAQPLQQQWNGLILNRHIKVKIGEILKDGAYSVSLTSDDCNAPLSFIPPWVLHFPLIFARFINCNYFCLVTTITHYLSTNINWNYSKEKEVSRSAENKFWSGWSREEKCGRWYW